MEQSRASQEIINLGKKIVSEFSREGGYNTSVQWMGHYLAELIHQSENAASAGERDLARKECFSHILELWEKRPYFPERLAPMSKLSHTIAVLNALKNEKLSGLSFMDYIERKSHSAIANYISSMRKSSEKIVECCMEGSVSEDDLKSEKEWLQHSAFLNAEENQVIDGIRINSTDNLSSMQKGKKNKGAKKKVELINESYRLLIENLRRQQALQLAYLEDLEKTLFPPKTKKEP